MKMINNWKPETRSLIRELVKAGFVLHSADNLNDDDSEMQFAGNMSKFLDHLLACDSARLYIRCPNSRVTVWLFLVLGNSPGELVSDWAIPSDKTDAALLDKVCGAHGKKWEGRQQPKISEAKAYPNAKA